MRLNEFVERLQKLNDAGYGGCFVYAVHGASGDCLELSTPFVRTLEMEGGPEGMGPYDDVKVGEAYIEVYAGN